MEYLFLELILVAIDQKEKLSRKPTEAEWRYLYDMSIKQTVVGITFCALDKLSHYGIKPPLDILYEWIGLSEQLKQQNRLLDKRCIELQNRYDKEGVQSAILKGQSVATFYGDKLRQYRQPGDIDIYVSASMSNAIEIAHKWGYNHVVWDYKHLHMDIWEDTEVEVHYKAGVLLNVIKNRQLNKWFKEHEADLHASIVDGIRIPSHGMNVVYLLIHLYHHFLYEGVGLRQFMDLYYVLRSEEHVDKAYIGDALRQFGMVKFTRSVMWVMKEVFLLEDKYILFEPLEDEGRLVLDEIMAGGNFGHYDERNKSRLFSGKVETVVAVCKHNARLFRHYPSDIIWSPLWFVWHKLWKIFMFCKLHLWLIVP